MGKRLDDPCMVNIQTLLLISLNPTVPGNTSGLAIARRRELGYFPLDIQVKGYETETGARRQGNTCLFRRIIYERLRGIVVVRWPE
jgi:hypothetical protein